MSPAPTVTAADLAPRLPLDANIAALADGAFMWLFSVMYQAFAVGQTLPMRLASMLPRLHTGYMGKVERTNIAHRTFRDGLCSPAPRVTADDRALATAQAWGMVA